jgi:mannose-6-phosphate isomerase-like protein (cupin superfamily)
VTARLVSVEGIHDLVSLRLAGETDGQGIERTVALRFEDHLLRRFGEAEIVRLAAGSSLNPPAREIADEVWIVVDGRAIFEWRDLRDSSPTNGATARLECDEPMAVLVPFGVAFSLHAHSPLILVRLASHTDDGAPPIANGPSA